MIQLGDGQVRFSPLGHMVPNGYDLNQILIYLEILKASQVANDAGVSGVTVKDALNTLSNAVGVGPPPFALNLLSFIDQSQWAAIQAYTTPGFDCWPAMNAAIAALPSLGGIIWAPPGLYNFSKTIKIDRFVNLQGAGSGQAGGQATTFLFPANVGGIIFGGDNAGVNSSGARLAGLRIYGGNRVGVVDGVLVRFRIVIEDIIVAGFGGNGITIGASVPAGNANNWSMNRVFLFANGLDGLQCFGSDANAGTAVAVSASNNGVWGIADQSFLGNTFIGCHTEANGEGLGPGAGGAYMTDNINCRAVFIGCYSESGQPPSQIVIPSMVIGGLHAAGFTNGSTGFTLGDTSTSFTIISTINDPSKVWRLGYAGSAIDMSADGGLTSQQVCRWEATMNAWVIGANHSSTDIIFTGTPDYPSGGYIADAAHPGTPVAQGYALYDQTRWVYLGGRTARQITQSYGTAPPGGAKPSGLGWNAGDIVFNTAPTAGGGASPFLGWVCVAAGTPGTWKTFGAISA